MQKRTNHFRYKICFQTQNKIWIYKNSRLRNFYRLRSKVLLLQGKIAKSFTIANNMKWRVIRRKMLPYNRTKQRFRYNYKNIFFNKQQLKNFYGKLHEYKIRNIFKKTWNIDLFYRKNIFIAALEQRINIVLFRMRVLPTIFSCTQLIMHKGILINNNLITLPSYRLKIGDVLSIPKNYWTIFYDFLYERLIIRREGDTFLAFRKINIVSKIQYYRLKNKMFQKNTLVIIKKYSQYKKFFLNLKRIFKILLKVNKKNIINIKSKLNKQEKLTKINKKYIYNLKIIIYINYFLEKTIRKIFFKLKKNIRKIRYYSYLKSFYKHTRYFHFKLFFIDKVLKKILNFALIFIKSNFENILNDKALIIINQFNNLLLQIQDNNKYKIEKYYWKNSLKRKSFLKSDIRYNKRILYKIKQIKYQKKKREKFKKWCIEPHWYIPQYLEIDYCTLRCVFVRYPQNNEVFFGFPCSFNKIISFYKERAL
jgi:ribosomal protein S4